MSEAPAVDYALHIIEVLAASGNMLGISDISRETGINKNAVSRILNSLTEYGWIYQDDLKYQLTLKPFQTVSSAVARISLYSISLPVLKSLWEQTGDSAYVGILKENRVLYIQHLDSVRDIKIAGRVGGMYPLHSAAPGKVLLAYSDDAFRRGYCEKYLERSTPNTITDPDAMLKHLEKIRNRGFATDVEEYGCGIICFAAPIFGGDGKVCGTIGISTSTIYSDEQAITANQGPIIIRAAEDISDKLGYATK